jgi:hypothetical protein
LELFSCDLLAGFASQGISIIKNDPAVWKDGAKPKYVFKNNMSLMSS